MVPTLYAFNPDPSSSPLPEQNSDPKFIFLLYFPGVQFTMSSYHSHNTQYFFVIQYLFFSSTNDTEIVIPVFYVEGSFITSGLYHTSKRDGKNIS